MVDEHQRGKKRLLDLIWTTLWATDIVLFKTVVYFYMKDPVVLILACQTVLINVLALYEVCFPICFL